MKYQALSTDRKTLVHRSFSVEGVGPMKHGSFTFQPERLDLEWETFNGNTKLKRRVVSGTRILASGRAGAHVRHELRSWEPAVEWVAHIVTREVPA